jgi:hypothetical protein
MSSIDTQIVPIKDRQLGFSPGQSDVSEYETRLRAGLKDADKLSKPELSALATLAMAHGLDPYNGECWGIPGKGVMAGIKGLRKAADSQLPPGSHRHPALRILQSQEYKDYGLDEKDVPNAYDKDAKKWVPNPVKLAAICELTRSDATQVYVDQLCQLTKSNVNYEVALSVIGPRPVWIGIGVVRKCDKSKMELGQLAFKRAESDALKKAFNLPFMVDVDGSEEQGWSVESSSESPIGMEVEEDPESIEETEEAEQKTGRPYPPDTVRKGIRSRVRRKPGATKATDKQMKYVRALLDSAFNESATPEKDRHAVTKWLIGKESSKDLTIAEASSLIEWLAAEEDGDLGLDGYTEAHAILAEVMREEGQLPLPMDESE